MTAHTQMLDRLFPLANASHADAVTYSILVPMRYAECVATLQDGSLARFRNPRRLVGWSGPVDRRAFLFHDGDRGIEIRTNAARRRQVRKVRQIKELDVLGRESLSLPMLADIGRVRKIIGRDGDLLYVRLQIATGVNDEQTATDRTTGIGMDAEPALEGCFS